MKRRSHPCLAFLGVSLSVVLGSMPLAAAPPATVVAEKGGGDLWSHLKIRMSNITEFKTTDQPGWRNNGTGFVAKTPGNGAVAIAFGVTGKGGITYEAYTVAVLVKNERSGKELLRQSEKISTSGGGTSFHYQWNPSDDPGPLRCSISISGGNPEGFTYYVSGTISCETPPPSKSSGYESNIGTSGAAFTGLNGNIEVSRDGGKTWEFAKREMPLNWGDHVKTGEDSKAIIGLADMSTFEMRSNSEIVIKKPEPHSPYRLLAGNLWMNVNRMLEGGSMEIEMNQAVAGIKGTTFELWENRKGASVLKVTEGLVSFRHKKTGQVVSVGPGQTFTATHAGMIQGEDSGNSGGLGGSPVKDGKVLDAVAEWGNGKAYLFKATHYVRYDIQIDRVDPGYPKPISEWTGLPWTNGIDAATNWGNGKAYFFKGHQYVRWDIKADRMDPGYPKPISEWAGLPWTDGIDAVANWGNGKAYFFKGSQYVRWDIKADRMDPGYPKPISEWTGLTWTHGIDAIANWGGGKVYFFKGSQYVRWDITAERVDPGYPKPINNDTWPGIQALLR